MSNSQYSCRISNIFVDFSISLLTCVIINILALFQTSVPIVVDVDIIIIIIVTTFPSSTLWPSSNIYWLTPDDGQKVLDGKVVTIIIILMSVSTTMGRLVRINARILIITHLRNETLRSK